VDQRAAPARILAERQDRRYAVVGTSDPGEDAFGVARTLILAVRPARGSVGKWTAAQEGMTEREGRRDAPVNDDEDVTEDPFEAAEEGVPYAPPSEPAHGGPAPGERRSRRRDTRGTRARGARS